MNPELNSIREVLRTISYWASAALVSPLVSASKLHLRLASPDSYKSYGMLLSLLPGLPGSELRQAFYRQTLRRCGRNLRLGFGSYFVSQQTEVGESLTTGSYCVIGPCVLGNDVAMASHVSVLDGLHQHGTADLQTPIIDQPGQSDLVCIGDQSWIGEGARVAASVGRRAVVGVGAVVTRPVKEAEVVLGNPARVVGNRSRPWRRSAVLLEAATADHK